jgi:hypothetical protein
MKTNKALSLIVVTIGFGLTTAAYAGQTYTLKGESPTGTRLQSVDAHANVPFDKRYYELTESQRESYRARFDSIGATQVPPFPRNGLQDVYRPLIDANEKGVRGVLNVDVVVDEQGRVAKLNVIDAPNNQLAAASAKILRNTQFDPGYCAGEPCKMTFPVQITYR